MKNTIGADYGAIPAAGYVDKLLCSQRRKLFDAFTAFKQDAAGGTVLNVGMLPASSFGGADYLSAWSDPQHQPRITSYQIGSRSGEADEIRLPFADEEFDWVFCSEVIEHVGSFERQSALVRELARVARKGVFLTTSNRRHPIEFKTALPLVHWLPHAWWRRILAWSGKRAWAAECAFTLVDSAVLYRLAELLPGQPRHDVGHKRVFGLKAHFFLMIQKHAAEQAGKKKTEAAPAA